MCGECEQLKKSLLLIAGQNTRFMDYRNLAEWDIRCHVCKAFSRNEQINGVYQMVFEHKTDCPIEIAKKALGLEKVQNMDGL